MNGFPALWTERWAHVPVLHEGLAAEVAKVGALAGVTVLMHFEVAKSGEGLRAVWGAAGLDSC